MFVMQSKASYTTRRFQHPLDDLLDRPIAFNPAFKRITGSTVAALFLSQAWYWSKRTSDDSGWFYKTGAEWEEETGLTRSEQETARRHLKALGLMEEDLRGIPATLYYRVNKDEVANKIATFPQTSMQGLDIQDSDIPANINIESETTQRLLHGANAPIFSEPLPVDWQVAQGVERVTLPSPEQEWQSKRDIALMNICRHGADLEPMARAFMDARRILPGKRDCKGWASAFREMAQAGVTERTVIQAVGKLLDYGMTIADPWAIKKTAIALTTPSAFEKQQEVIW
jgi:hypothetical protein